VGGYILSYGPPHQTRWRRTALHLRLRSGGGQPALFAHDFFRV
jgi:hypothetical protein